MAKPATFSTKIDLSLVDKLKKDLEEKGFSFSYPPYSAFSAKTRGISLTVYESGALVCQGKDKDEFIEFYLEPEILKDLTYTNPLSGLDLTPKIGVDEAGKGDFFGPLCITSLYADKKGIEELIKLGVKDSKKISDKKAVDLAKKLKSEFFTSTLRLFPIKYNELYDKFKNLNRMLAWAHATVIADLVEKTGCKHALIDKFGPDSYVENALKYKNISLNLEQKTKGENDPVVAAASIIARASFLEGIQTLSDEVGIELPKGANNGVIEAGKKLVNKYDNEILTKACKLHFKTLNQVMN